MKVALLQSAIIWENSEANRTTFSNRIDSISNVELIILPEMFSTGFTMHPATVAETMTGKTVTWMKAIAAQKNAAICGSVVITENGNFYNRLIFVYPSGEMKYYDKRHLFTLAGEDKVYTPGMGKQIIDHNGFSICLQICYDLRFPVFARNVENYDLLIYVANWPEPRIAAWDALLKARAIENMAFVIGVNRVGKDGNNHNYIGHSQAFDALGNGLSKISEQEDVIIVDLNKNELLDARKKFAFLDDRDDFTVI